MTEEEKCEIVQTEVKHQNYQNNKLKKMLKPRNNISLASFQYSFHHIQLLSTENLILVVTILNSFEDFLNKNYIFKQTNELTIARNTIKYRIIDKSKYVTDQLIQDLKNM